MKNKGFTKRGFTIIELIVVIAIIAVLSSIVMVNVTKYTKASKDTAIKADMGSLTSSATIFFESRANFSSFCESGIPSVDNVFGQVSTMVGKNYDCKQNDSSIWNACCHDSNSNWSACIQLVSDSTKAWCIDSYGTKKQISNSDCRVNRINSGCPAS